MNNNFENAIKTIYEKLQDINYVFIGSGNLYLQGLNVSPRDIDILTTPQEIKKIDKILDQYRTREIYFDGSEGRNSFRSFYKINNIEIEVLGNVDNKCRSLDSINNKVTIAFKDISVPCLALEEELLAYKKMGREEKVKTIEDYMKQS